MKSVLISIQPKWCEKIANGEKTIEVRKSSPKLEPPFKCYIYMTKGFASYPVGNGMRCHNNGGGVVIGEFVCDEVIPIKVFDSGSIQDWNNHNLERACVPYEEMAEYIGWGKTGYAWHISDLVIYDEPNALDYFYSICREYQKGNPQCGNCDYYEPMGEYPPECACHGVKYLYRPPQSWCYVEGGLTDG